MPVLTVGPLHFLFSKGGMMLAILPPCPIALPTKVCNRCDAVKSLTEFYSDGRARDGISSRCLTCQRTADLERRRRANKQHYKKYGSGKYAENRAAWHARNPHKKWQYHKKKYERPEGRAMHLLNGAKMRRPEGFTLTLEHVTEGILRGYCDVTGIPFNLQINRKQGLTRHPHAPSLDKIKPKEPYTNENTRVVIWQYNAMKGELSDAEILELCRIIVAKADQ